LFLITRYITVFTAVTTCLENQEMSGNLTTAVRQMSGVLLKVKEVSGKKSRQGGKMG